MKSIKLLSFSLIALSITLISCGGAAGGGDCKTCEQSAGGVSITSTYCQNGDDVVVTVNGTETTVPGTNMTDYIKAMEAAGAKCK